MRPLVSSHHVCHFLCLHCPSNHLSPPAADDGPLVRDYVFRDLQSLLPSEALLVMNQSRVITARLLMNKEGTGGKAEVRIILDERSRLLAVNPFSQALHLYTWNPRCFVFPPSSHQLIQLLLFRQPQVKRHGNV